MVGGYSAVLRSRRRVQHDDEVWGVDFDPHGQFLFTCGKDSTARIWEWTTGKPISPPIAQLGATYQIVVTPDGKHAVTAGSAGPLGVLPLDDLGRSEFSQLDSESLSLWGEIVSGRQEVGVAGGVVNLTSRQWLQRWNTFRQRHPDFHRAISAKN